MFDSPVESDKYFLLQLEHDPMPHYLFCLPASSSARSDLMMNFTHRAQVHC